MVEWYVDAIIGYVLIHNKEKLIPKNEILKEFNISNDSKKLAKNSYLKKINNTFKASYINYSKNNFNNLFNIENVNYQNFPKNIDIFTYSFPCQDLSIQGLQLGINKDLKTRSGLLWEVERLFLELKNNFEHKELPKYLLMENVANLVGKNNIKNYQLWISQLEKIGYETKTYLLNSKDFGSCQSRLRVFGLSVRKDFKKEVNFEFDNLQPINANLLLKDIIDVNNTDNLLDLSKYQISNYKTTKNGVINKTIYNYTKFNSENYIYSIDGKGPTLTASGANSRIKIEFNNNIRYMTSYEALIYMGFDSDDYLKIKKSQLISDNKIIYLAGNSISVQVLEAIFKTLKF